MTNSGGFAVTRTRSGDQFYNPPAMRRHQQLVFHHQQLQRKLQRPSQEENRVDLVEAETRIDSGQSTLSRPNSVCSDSAASLPRNADFTNLDRLIDSVTPFVQAQYISEGPQAGTRGSQTDIHPFFSLGDLWDAFSEWSVYGVEVPLLLNGGDSVKQYYVPSLSGVQLYIDPHRLRKHSDNCDAESSIEATSAGNSDCEAERQAKGVLDGTHRGQDNLFNLNSQKLNRLTLRDRPTSSSSDETEVCNSPGLLEFEYLEKEQPHHRRPLYDKVTSIASEFPAIRMYRSCDLLPASWVSVAWYPIYRIPVGPTLQSLDASFLTFHSLSTIGRRKNQPQFHGSSGKKVNGIDASSKIPVPVFGLASYKFRSSVLTPNGAYEWQQANSLLQNADHWLQNLQVDLPDFQFFLSHNSQRR